MSFGNIIVSLVFNIQRGRNNCFRWGKSRENNRGDRLGCLKCSYGNGHHRTTLSGYIFTTKERIDSRKKKLVKQQYLLHKSAQYGKLWPTIAAGIVSLVWGIPANFNGFRVLASLLQRRRSKEANQTLHNVWSLPGLVDYIYIFGGCCSVMEFCQVQKSHLLPRSLALSYSQRYCTAVEQWLRAKVCGVEHRAPPIFCRVTIRLGIGPHSSSFYFKNIGKWHTHNIIPFVR